MAESVVTANKAVFITYTITDDQGNLFERYDVPVGYVHGVNSELFIQIENALDGHKVGDKVEVRLHPEESFGYPDPGLIAVDAIENVPPEYRVVGAEAVLENEKGESRTMTVTKIEDGKITIDGNHPLAGKMITFAVTIAEIRDATQAEIANGIPAGNIPIH